jgi:hypothetical protein
VSFMGFGCDHEWEVTAKTYAPPRPHGLDSSAGSDSDVLKFVERAECGVTTVLMVCACCGETYETEMLGKEVGA